jgi:Flp pilus assembly protein TadG
MKRRATRTQDGQALVEFALVIPVFLLLVMGIIQFGFVFKDYIALTDATRVGARQASVARSIQPPEARVASVVARVERAAVNLDTSKLTVTVEPLNPANNMPEWVAAGDVTVKASYPFKVNLFGLVVMSGTMKTRTTERVE